MEHEAPKAARRTGKVFISYRRDGGAEMARLIRDSLRQRGYRVFMDVEDLRSGPFNIALLREIESSTDVVVVITPGSLDRCRQEGDWVRLEVAHAIESKTNLVPVMTGGFQWPSQPLPEDIAALPGYSGLAPSLDFFDASMDRLTQLLAGGPGRRVARPLWFAAGIGIVGVLVALGIALATRAGRPGSGTEAERAAREAASPVSATERDPLALHWYGFGQRQEGGAWREFRVQDGMTMFDGDQFRVAFSPTADCHVYVLMFNADGAASQLFPNPAIQQGALCRGGQTCEIPDGINWFTLDDKGGTETLYLIASYDLQTDLQALAKAAGSAGSPADAGKAVEQQIALV